MDSAFLGLNHFPSLLLGSALRLKDLIPPKAAETSMKKSILLKEAIAMNGKNFPCSASFHWQTKVSRRGNPFASSQTFDRFFRRREP